MPFDAANPGRDLESVEEELRRKIRRGIEQANRGELLDGAVVIEEIRQLSGQRRRNRSQSEMA